MAGTKAAGTKAGRPATSPGRPAEPAPDAPDGSGAGDGTRRRPAGRQRQAQPAGGGRSFRPFEGTAADTGAGFLLGVFVWAWVVLPLLRGGPAEVRKMLRAKFLNKGSDGKVLG